MVGTKVKHSELRRAVRDLQNRGLLHSARWAAEQLYGLEDESPDGENAAGASTPTPKSLGGVDDDDDMELETPVGARGNGDTTGTEDEHAWTGHTCSPVSAGDDYVLAKAYFDLGEHRRASHQLSENRTSLGRFLRYYALYLAGEKRKNEEMLEGGGGGGAAGGGGGAQKGGGNASSSDKTAVNPELDAIDFDLRVLLEDAAQGTDGGTAGNGTASTATPAPAAGTPVSETKNDPFLRYLHGLVLLEKDQKAEAKIVLVKAAKGYPCHWGAWEALLPLCSSVEEAEQLDLPRHWMRKWFLAALHLELQENRKGLQAYAGLVLDIPASSIGVVQMAVGHYNMREFDRAQSIFEDVYRADPYRLEGMDTYSNILYVKEDAAKLSYLAHGAVTTDKYRPETCCIVGNYYSLKSQHEKAVVYFSRALKLNWRYLSAWTLMGHEFVEMKNPAAAIDAYRHAVDINPRDYRAWYGLGQTYEILQMPYYALYYYQRATKLRPKDPRMWCAMGQCYESEQLLMTVAAIRCYQRAVTWNDMEGIALAKLAKLHRESGNLKAAAHYYRLNVLRLEKEAPDSGEHAEALLFLANYYKRNERFKDAEACCTRLLDFAGPEKQNAKAMLREMHNIQDVRLKGGVVV